MFQFNKSILVVLIFLTIALAGCSQMKPANYHPISEVPEGPGLFTGERGGIILTR